MGRYRALRPVVFCRGDRTEMLRYVPYLLVLGLWIYAFIDCLTTPEEEVRHLPKVVWIIIVLLFGEVLVGPVAWLVAGKRRGPLPVGGTTPAPRPRERRAEWVAPDDNPEFLKSLKDEDGEKDEHNDAKRDQELLRDWEADLRRREEKLRRRENGQEPDGKAAGTDSDG